MIFRTATLVAGFLALGALPALAWDDAYRGDGTTRAGQNLVYPYPARENFCPAGLQPVLANGEVCCGKPNVSATYYNAPTRKISRKKVVRRAQYPRAYAPEGIKGVIYK
ncbi:MAG: hypothetical protein EP318_20595 [Rhodobacteraceae bacterium]|nr:MAG: hypothetical protein EP318_20595 [Paracoccaceae bacterium]